LRNVAGSFKLGWNFLKMIAEFELFNVAIAVGIVVRWGAELQIRASFGTHLSSFGSYHIGFGTHHTGFGTPHILEQNHFLKCHNNTGLIILAKVVLL
jgi:hypothetical protein